MDTGHSGYNVLLYQRGILHQSIEMHYQTNCTENAKCMEDALNLLAFCSNFPFIKSSVTVFT